MPGRRGFSLIEVIIAISLVAIMSMAVAPLVAQRINRTREQATVRELDRVRKALLAYYEDLGHFPSESIGLAALVSDTAEANWQGPYIAWSTKDPTEAATTDQFGEQYVYDLTPSTTPAGAADLIVASTGINRNSDLLVGGGWALGNITACDDLIIILNSSGQNRDKRAETIRELNNLAEAARVYYRANSTLPPDLSTLAGDYIDTGIRQSAMIDGWGNNYRAEVSLGANPVLKIWSSGTDRTNDNGANDDLLFEINSAALAAESLTAPAGTETTTPDEGSYTEYLIATAQAALDANPGLALHGKKQELKEYLNALGLSNIFEHDDWGKKIKINNGTRTIYSSGPDKKSNTTGDNIPPGVGP
ncbi:MAG: prepilin-type N-terminal cleavage/methylation domain-containing protein [bacterium]|nr:prepilin-type N-terminal cleavage/methylation domain-containing protein [bacterium]